MLPAQLEQQEEREAARESRPQKGQRVALSGSTGCRCIATAALDSCF